MPSPEPARFPGLVENEAYCMELARACDLPFAAIGKALTGTGMPYVIVERYDRNLTVEPIRRLHQEDFCQARSSRRPSRTCSAAPPPRLGAWPPRPPHDNHTARRVDERIQTLAARGTTG